MTISSDMYSVLDNDSEISPKRTEEQRQANGKKNMDRENWKQWRDKAANGL